MNTRLETILTALLFVLVTSACESFSEQAKGLRRPSYSEAANARKNAIRPSPEQLNRLMAECPKPNGVFMNDAQERGGILLARYFLVPGFETPATSFPGGRSDDPPLAASASPINILGGIKNGVRQNYYPDPLEKFTLELRPLEAGRFRIGVKSSTGLSGEAEGYLNLSGERQRCENGVLKAFWSSQGKTFMGWALYVDADSGDIVVHSPGGYFYGFSHDEHYARFKRIAP